MGHLTTRITLRRSMAVIFLMCVALAFLRYAAKSWEPGEVEIVALAILLGTNVLAWFQKARWQVFWTGFGIFGWAYLAISLGSRLGELLPTTRLLDEIYDSANPTPLSPVDFVGAAQLGDWTAHGVHFRRAGHCLFALAFGVIGGVGAIRLVPMKPEPAVEPSPPDGSLLNPDWRERKQVD